MPCNQGIKVLFERHEHRGLSYDRRCCAEGCLRRPSKDKDNNNTLSLIDVDVIVLKGLEGFSEELRQDRILNQKQKCIGMI